MLLNVDFVCIFIGFLNRYHLNKCLLNKSSNLLNKFEFFMLFVYLINMQKIHFFYDINKFLIKDYKYIYIIEFYLKFKCLFTKKWFWFCFRRKYNIYIYSDFKFRVNIILFFTLGKYIEFLRYFFFNEYLNVIIKPLKKVDIKFPSKILKNKKMYYFYNFRRWIFKNVYILYYRCLNTKFKEPVILKLQNKDLIFNNKIFNKYFKYLFLYNRLWYIFFFFFLNYLRSYYILFNYKCWRDYGWYFKYLSKVRVISIFALYGILSKIKMQLDYYFIHFIMHYLKNKINKLFFQNNISLLLLKNNFSLVNMNKDIVIINYISRLYYFVLNSFLLSDKNKLNFDVIMFWDIFEDWYHFDYILLPDLYKSSRELFLWLSLFKYNYEFTIWNIFHKNIFHNYISNNFLLSFYFINVDIKLDFISLIFFDVLCNYFFRYLLKYFSLFKLVFMFNFINDYCIKLFCYNPLNNLNNNHLNYLRIKQFKYYYLNCLMKHRYVKFYDFYLNNINEY